MEDLVVVGTTLNSMPELPEVQTVKTILERFVPGHKILSIEVLRDSIINGDKDEFVNSLVGEQFLSLSRIGKYLIFHLTNDIVIISHLRMEGKYYEYNENEDNSKYARVVFHLDGNKKLVYDDSRTFGEMILSSENEYRTTKELSKLGQEPWDITDVKPIKEKTQKSTLPIKTLLLSQEYVVGLGNIYVDEVLFACRINPLTSTKDITLKQWEDIVFHSSRIMKDAIESGGSTIRSYHPGKDINGEFQTKLLVYSHKGEPCPACKTKLKFIKVGGRGTTYCPFCQPLKQDKLVIGLTGEIASGKSSATKLFKELGAHTISADEVVNKLYENSEEIAVKLTDLTQISFKLSIDKALLRNYLIEHPKDVKKVNAIVHPLVINEIKKEIFWIDKGMIVVEVPLLFEAKMEKMFDFIVGVTISEEEQFERLKNRDHDKARYLKAIYNSNNVFNKNMSKLDFVIDNSSTMDNLQKQVNLIFSKLKGLLN